jgi:hypothetical protein
MGAGCLVSLGVVSPEQIRCRRQCDTAHIHGAHRFVSAGIAALIGTPIITDRAGDEVGHLSRSNPDLRAVLDCFTEPVIGRR